MTSDNVRISGIRLLGAASDDPFDAVNQPDSDGIVVHSSPNVEIDHCEIDHWRGSAVVVYDGQDRIDLDHAETVWVHDNFIHHNQHPTEDFLGGGHGAGYRVVVAYGAYALIEKNVFGANPHAIAGDGRTGTGYLVYRNLILPHGGINSKQLGVIVYTHAIDMHGRDDCGVFGDYNCGPAGDYMDVAASTVRYTAGSSINLRGTPTIRMNVVITCSPKRTPTTRWCRPRRVSTRRKTRLGWTPCTSPNGVTSTATVSATGSWPRA